MLLNLFYSLLMLGSYCLAAFAVFPLLSYPLKKLESSKPFSLLLALGFGPLLISFSLETLIFFFEFSSFINLIISTIFFVIIIGAFCHYFFRPEQTYCFKSSEWNWLFNRAYAAGLVGILLIAAFMFSRVFFLPITANDPLEYAASARLLFDGLSLQNYPYLETDKNNGYYGPWTHPLGYIGLILWGYLIQGTHKISAVISLISLYYYVLLFLLPICLSGKSQKPSTILAFAYSIGLTPLIFSLTLDSHIDPIRILVLTCFAILHAKTFNNGGLKNRVILGLVLGLTLYCHSINILLIPLLIIIHIIVCFRTSPVRVLEGIYIALIAVSLNSFRYYTNYKLFGHPVADTGAVPVWALESLMYEEYFEIIRGFSTFREKWLLGGLGLLTKPHIYGIAGWIFLLSLWLQLRDANFKVFNFIRNLFGSGIQSIAQLYVLGFLAMMILSLVLGMDSFIKNIRYMLTIVPLSIISTQLYLTHSNKQSKEKNPT